MKAVVHEEYGSPAVLRIAEVPKPVPNDDQILIKIHAVSINGSDREGLTGKPLYARLGGLRRPGNRILGSDIAGRVESVGKNHTEFKSGDEIFGEIPGYRGGLAEYVCTDGATMMRKPHSLTFEEAAAIPQGGVIAYNGICKKGRVQRGQKVLINGGGGSAGSFAIQLAKLSGAEVTGVDNGGKLEFMRSLGADHVIDYTRQDFTTKSARYDLILDLVAHRSVFACARVLSRAGTYFFVGGSLGVAFQLLLFGPWIKTARKKNVRMLVVPQNRQDLISITELCEARRIIPAIHGRYSFNEAPAALRAVVDGVARGKVVITVP